MLNNRLKFSKWLVVLLCLSSVVLRGEEQQFTIVIDAGHGGRDPGARGEVVNEKAINLSVALKLGSLLSQLHPEMNIIYTRRSDRFIELDERANIANRNKADLFISIHTNAVRNGRGVIGAETYTLGLARSTENLEVAKRENSAILLEENYLQRYEGFDPHSAESYIIFEFMQNKHMEQSVELASDIQKEFQRARRIDRGVRQAGLLVLRKTSMPSVLVELGFITNKSEERYMRSSEGQNRLAKALYDAITTYKRRLDHKKSALRETDKSAAAREGELVYKVQILTSGVKLSANSPRFKGYKPVAFYQENGSYKYTYGESTDLEEMKSLRKKLLKDFEGAFIVIFKNGERIH